ncbi:hypothetical protein ACIBTP_41210 [Streptomyces avidinii]|uniref:hypothetical protein n=1 Tax=Streptomyces avidinii TaxID=1895 RepID=UPI0037BD7FF0
MRNLITAPVLYVLARAPQVGGLLVLLGLLGLIQGSGMPVVSGLLVLVVASLGAAAVALAVVLPYLPDRPPATAAPPHR